MLFVFVYVHNNPYGLFGLQRYRLFWKPPNHTSSNMWYLCVF